MKLYSLQSWDTPIEADFPRFGLQGTPTDVLPLTRRLLKWYDVYLHFHCPDAPISTITIFGSLGWEIDSAKTGYRIMREVETNQPFAAAAIALGEREGQFWAFVIGDEDEVDVRIEQIPEKQLNMLRDLKLQHAE